MYSNLERYVADRKPPLGAVLNPYLSINRGLVFFPPFNEGSGNKVFDLSGNGNTGTLTNAPIWVGGKFGPALDFGADSYVNLGNDSTLNSAQYITVIIRFKIDTGSVIQIILAGLNGTSKFHIWSHNKIMTQVKIGGAATNFYSNTVLTVGDWYQFVYTYDGAKERIYLNGVEDAFRIETGVLDSATQATTLSVAGDYTMKGMIDHALIYDNVKSASEIAELYREPFCGFRWTSIEQLAAYIEEAPPEIKALFMDLSTQLWTIKHSTGIFTKL